MQYQNSIFNFQGVIYMKEVITNKEDKIDLFAELCVNLIHKYNVLLDKNTSKTAN